MKVKFNVVNPVLKGEPVAESLSVEVDYTPAEFIEVLTAYKEIAMNMPDLAEKFAARVKAALAAE